MEGIYSITMDGEKIGTLKVGRQGGYTLFEADCRWLPGLVRLSVYGRGREGYLGLLAPQGERMHLKKKLSPSDMRGFPEAIESVGSSGGMKIEAEPVEEAMEEPVTESEPEESVEEQCMEEQGPFWYASPDGALVSVDSGRQMVALPMGDERTPKNIPGECRVIEGKKYVVYITKELA